MIVVQHQIYNNENDELILGSTSLFDTGATICAISKDKFDYLNFKIIGQKEVSGLLGTDKFDYTEVSVILNNKIFKIYAIIIDSFMVGNLKCDFIIGENLYTKFNFEYINNVLTIK